MLSALRTRRKPPDQLIFSGADLRALIGPLIIENILSIAVGFVNSIMVATAGEAAISSVSLVEAISLLIMNIFTAMATGGAVVAAQYKGMQDIQGAKRASEQLVLSIALISGVICALCLAFNVHILRLIFGDVSEDVLQNAVTYFTLSALSYPMIALFNAGAALFRTSGNAKIPMIHAGIMNIINVLLNLLFIYAFRMGVLGAGISTLIARTFSCGAVLIMLSKNRYELYIENYFKIRWDWRYIKKIFAIGVPSGIENSLFQLGRIVLQSLISGLGTYALAANSVANNVNGFVIIPASAMNLAVITVVGQCVGARRYDQVDYYIKKLMLFTYAATAALGLLLIAFLPAVLNLYHLTDLTYDLARQCILIHSVAAIFFWPMSFTLPNALRAANDVKFILITSLITMWLFRIGLGYVMIVHWNFGVVGVWLAMCVDFLLRSICFAWRYLSGRWKQNQLL